MLVFDIPTTTRFRGLTRRQGILVRGQAGWGEWSPFREYVWPEIGAWWAATVEAAELGFPEAVRTSIPVNCTVPAVDPDVAAAIVRDSGCRTAKVKVAESGQSVADDLERVEAVRAALGPQGKVRVDANGAWSVDEAFTRLRQLARFDLEYAEQPCRSVEELAHLRRRFARSGLSIRIAADESIRRSDDPAQVRALEAADIAVLKVQPLGGVRRCLQVADDLGLPVVVSSALETSVGIRAGIALAAALPELEFACGLNTVPLLAHDVVTEPLIAVDGMLPVGEIVVSEDRSWIASDEVTAWWHERFTALQDEMRETR